MTLPSVSAMRRIAEKRAMEMRPEPIWVQITKDYFPPYAKTPLYLRGEYRLLPRGAALILISTGCASQAPIHR